MKVKGGNEIAKHISNRALAKTGKLTEKDPLPKNDLRKNTGTTVVNLSQRSKEVLKAQQVIQSTTNVRTEKVQAIKERIGEGSYQIDHDKIAEKMLKSLS
ncbi:MAG: flagellar biosynthesis anti-sigma factor FlgM [Deltaproteobacteria bacterium]|nr:flagellar biosynthesis anti-sigma factor FlgM [Deltaproteobacteria bacterium]